MSVAFAIGLEAGIGRVKEPARIAEFTGTPIGVAIGAQKGQGLAHLQARGLELFRVHLDHVLTLETVIVTEGEG
jgi:hypothetical protein